MVEFIEVKELCNIKKGKKVKAIKTKTEKTIPYLLIDTLRGKEPELFTEDENFTEAIPDDILIVGDGANSGLVGTGLSGAVGSTIIRIRANLNKIHKDYLTHFLKSKFQILNTNVKGAAIPHLKPKEMMRMKIRLPNIEEQQQIVDEIEKQLTRLDDSVKTLKDVKRKLEVYRKSVLKAAFEGEFTSNVRLVDVTINDIKAKIPINWKKEKFDDFAQLQGGYAFKSRDYTNSGIRLVKIANVYIGDLDWTTKTFVPNSFYDIYKNFQLKKGDLVMAMTRPVIKSLSTIKTGIVKEKDLPALLNQRVGRFIIKDENKLNKKYLLYYVFTVFFKERVIKESSSTNQPNISSNRIKEFDIPICSLEEQQQIVQEIESRFSVIYKVEEVVDNSLKKAEQLRKSILKAAFEGKLVREVNE